MSAAGVGVMDRETHDLRLSIASSNVYRIALDEIGRTVALRTCVALNLPNVTGSSSAKGEVALSKAGVLPGQELT